MTLKNVNKAPSFNSRAAADSKYIFSAICMCQDISWHTF